MKIKLTQEHVDAAISVYEHGWYTLKVEEYKLKEDKDGADLHTYIAKIVDADEQENKRFSGRKAFFQFSEKGLGFMIPFLKACGAEIPEKITEEGVSIDPEACVGKTVKAQNNPKPNPKTKNMQNNWSVFARVE